jgi:quercetin dioxygenase-like cupin family protein/ketosteroid isomerase-like protein
MMPKTVRWMSALALAILGSRAAAAPAASTWDPKAAGEVRAALDKMFAAIDALDMAGIRAAIAADAFQPSYDVDFEMKPVVYGSPDDVLKMFEGVAAQVKAAGGKLKTTATKADCKAVATLGVCAIDMEQSMMMPGAPAMTASYRATAVAHKDAGGWRFNHWHASLAKVPAPPAETSAVAPADLKWVDGPGGAKLALAWKDPATGASGTYVKFPAGAKFPRHYHSAASFITVLEGTYSYTDDAGKTRDVKAGGFGYQPPAFPHTTQTADGTTFLWVSQGGPLDLVPFDEHGKPLPPMDPFQPPPAASASR